MKRLAVPLCILSVCVFGAGCSATPETVNTNTVGDANISSNAATEPAAPVVPSEDIIYGTNRDPVFVEESRTHCESLGGTFTECGSACKNPEDVCIQVCALRCER